ncbi:MAG: hypothetical protein ACOZBL_00845 [Patescibacteria group bacterium]
MNSAGISDLFSTQAAIVSTGLASHSAGFSAFLSVTFSSTTLIDFNAAKVFGQNSQSTLIFLSAGIYSFIDDCKFLTQSAALFLLNGLSFAISEIEVFNHSVTIFALSLFGD